MTAVMNISIVFGWGVVTGYFIACSVVRHIERQPIKVDSFKFGSLDLNKEETARVLDVLKDAVKRKATERRHAEH